MQGTAIQVQSPPPSGVPCGKHTRSGESKRAFWKPLVPAAIVAGLVALLAGVRHLLDPLLGEHHAFVLSLAAVFLSAWCYGWTAAAAALGLSLLVADFLFVPPRGSLGLASIEQQVGAIVYGIVGVISIVLIEALQRANHRSQAQAIRLCAEVAEHERTQEALQQTRAELERRVARRTAQLTTTNGQLRQAESKVRRLAALVASSEDAIIGKDLDGTITDWNTGAEHLFGYAPEEAVGRHVSFLAAGDQDEESARITASLQRGERSGRLGAGPPRTGR